jgi:hypothetical protein
LKILQNLKILPALCLIPGVLSAQDTVPPDLEEVELARSRSCVANLAALAGLEAEVEPYAQRVDRLNALGLAVSLEKPQDVAPFDSSDSTEAAVSAWFEADSVLATRYLAAPDSTILEERGNARTAILDRLRQEIQAWSEEAQRILSDNSAVRVAAEPCVGAILVRSAVLEACADTPSPVCDAAREQEPQGSYPFVENPSDLWDVEEFGPWSRPEPLRLGPRGELSGASTSARARLGNVEFHLTLRPLLRLRSELSPEEVIEYQSNLDSLGFSFDHPDFVMAAGIDLSGSLPPPLGGETHYLLHFGDLSGEDVIWSMEASGGGPLRAVSSATDSELARLIAGETVSLTAVRAPEEEGGEGEVVYSLALLQVGQTANVGGLVQYFADGSLSRDLRALVPPKGGR